MQGFSGVVAGTTGWLRKAEKAGFTPTFVRAAALWTAALAILTLLRSRIGINIWTEFEFPVGIAWFIGSYLPIIAYAAAVHAVRAIRGNPTARVIRPVLLLVALAATMSFLNSAFAMPLAERLVNSEYTEVFDGYHRGELTYFQLRPALEEQVRDLRHNLRTAPEEQDKPYREDMLWRAMELRMLADSLHLPWQLAAFGGISVLMGFCTGLLGRTIRRTTLRRLFYWAIGAFSYFGTGALARTLRPDITWSEPLTYEWSGRVWWAFVLPVAMFLCLAFACVVVTSDSTRNVYE